MTGVKCPNRDKYVRTLLNRDFVKIYLYFINVCGLLRFIIMGVA